MAATVITRASLVDNVTLWSAATVNSAVYDAIDAMFGGSGSFATFEFGGAVKVTGALLPTVSNTPALGSTSLMWADLFLGSGAVVNFDNGDVTITHSTNTLTFAGAASGYVFSGGGLFQSGGAVDLNAGTSNFRLFGGASGTRFFPTLASERTISGMTELGGLSFSHTSTYDRISGIEWYADSATGASANTKLLIYVTDGGVQRALTLDGSTTTPLMSWVGNIAVGATNRIYLDGVAGTGDTYIVEGAADRIDFIAGGTNAVQIGSTAVSSNVDVNIAATKRLYLDGGVDTYITEYDNNRFAFYAGNTLAALVSATSVDSRGTTGIGYYASSANTNTGTAVVRNADGYLYLTSSSRRFKENISTAVVTDAQLDAFMATTPSWWDYKGQKNGALGFIAEDLAALPMERYGFNPLVNYDAEGQIESNRDYALIAMHHLVIQRMQKEINALKARIH